MNDFAEEQRGDGWTAADMRCAGGGGGGEAVVVGWLGLASRADD
jgi:hypothetical protein